MDTRTVLAFSAGTCVGAGACWWAVRHGLPSKRTTEYGSGCRPPLPPLPHPGEGPFDFSKFEEDEVVAEHLTRNVQFFGLPSQKRIAESFVVVVGLGGVGSHAAHLLLRSGVGRLRLVDFDQVSLSSLNRHCNATRADVGMPKAECLAAYFRQVMPEAQIEAVRAMYTEETEEHILAGNPDFVLDAIDNIDTKVALLVACRARGIPVLASAGAGAKADPTRLRIVDVAESVADPLARAVRHRLRREHGIADGVPVLLSTEKPRVGLIFGGEEGASPLDYQVVPNFRIRTIPVLGTMPALFGMAAASWILCQLAGKPFVPEPVFTIEIKQYQTQLHRLEDREHARFGTSAGVQVDLQEVEALVREYWRGRSARQAVGSNDKGLGRSIGHLALTRWDAGRPASPGNLVLLTQEEADAHDALAQGSQGSVHDALALQALRAREPAFCARVEAVLGRVRAQFGC
uniref:THIF-type NAD/FAD binding fold domain-containing protein n=2 Tax=Auxenochlorella protothecoides TaxID=3075 RepID=A0A1D2A1J0_AUXPR